MPNNRAICFVSGNQNKVNEIVHLVPKGFRIYGLSELGLNTEIEETGSTLQENSAIKARFVYDRFHVPCFADDTGLQVDALNGMPGVYSARYAGPEKDPEANMRLLLRELRDKPNRDAHFITVITYIDAEGIQYQFEGVVNGKILHQKKGAQGFGYDPVFQPDGAQQTFAEMSMDAKNKISHRARAFKAFFSFLNSGG